MRVDAGLALAPQTPDLPAVAAAAVRAAAAVGVGRLLTAETAHDPFLPLAVAADPAAQAGLELGTNIAVAFARSPMTTASAAHGLHAMTGGRFVLGLGSQVKAHVTRRFSMPWSRPAARMREYVAALHHIWDAWENGTRLGFEGDFYTHTLSAPMFEPGPLGHPPPKVLVAAVGERMTEVAGEVADGVHCHGFTSASYLREVTLPALRRGQAAAGRTEAELEVCMPVFLATGPVGADLTEPVARLRRQVSFYASTPAYRGVLEHHGWGDLHVALHELSREQRWAEMAALVDDEVLTTFGVVADASALGEVLCERFDGLVDRLRLNVDLVGDPETWGPVVARLNAGTPVTT